MCRREHQSYEVIGHARMVKSRIICGSHLEVQVLIKMYNFLHWSKFCFPKKWVLVSRKWKDLRELCYTKWQIEFEKKLITL